MANPHPYPLILAPMLFDKVWGGDRLARFGKPVRAGARVGESWEVADLASTSASGAGGGAAISMIADGPLKGKSLHDAVEQWGEALLGASAERTPRFPLLVKFLDARENLSVQVHPSIAYARAHPGSHIKTECWYVLDAAPGAVIYKGVRAGVTRASFESHLRQGEGGAIVGDLEAAPAVVGEMHNFPSGTVHALGAGVLVAEVQTPSDTTFRAFDWGRAGREIHIEQALECIQFGPARGATWLPAGDRRVRLVSNGYFTVDELALNPGEPAQMVDTLADAGTRRCRVVMVVSGACELAAEAGVGVGGFEPVALSLGASAVVPAAIADLCQMKTASAKGARLLVTTVM